MNDHVCFCGPEGMCKTCVEEQSERVELLEELLEDTNHSLYLIDDGSMTITIQELQEKICQAMKSE